MTCTTHHICACQKTRMKKLEQIREAAEKSPHTYRENRASDFMEHDKDCARCLALAALQAKPICTAVECYCGKHFKEKK